MASPPRACHRFVPSGIKCHFPVPGISLQPPPCLSSEPILPASSRGLVVSEVLLFSLAWSLQPSMGTGSLGRQRGGSQRPAGPHGDWNPEQCGAGDSAPRGPCWSCSLTWLLIKSTSIPRMTPALSLGGSSLFLKLQGVLGLHF